MTIKKILTSLVLVGFLFVNVVPYTTHAVQLFGDDINYKTGLSIPPIVDGEGQSYFSMDPDFSSGLSSLVCIAGQTDSGKCETYVATATPMFLVDLEAFNKNEEYNTQVSYTIGGNHLIIYAKMPRAGQDEEYIYFYYGGSATETPLAKVNRNKKCGTKNSNSCVIAFHFYMYFSSLESGNEGLYLAHVDMIKYSDENDNFLYYRDEKWKNEKVGFLQSIYDFILQKPGYGKKLFSFSNGYSVFNGKDMKTGKYMSIFLNKGTIDSYFQTAERNGNYASKSRGSRGYILGMNDFTAHTMLKSENALIRDFLVGNSDDRLRGTLKEYFGAVGAISGVVNNQTGNVETDPNIYSDENFNKHCGTDVGCHIGNLGITIKSGLSSVFGGFFDGVKSIFSWIWEKLKTFFNPFIKPIYDFIENIIEEGKIMFEKLKTFFNDIYEIIKNLFKGGTDPTIAHNTLTLGAGFRASFNQSILCEKNILIDKPQQEEGFIKFVFSIFKGIFSAFTILDPIAPTNGTEICTYEGVKTLHLRKNSFFDLIIVMMFSLMSFLLFYKINNS